MPRDASGVYTRLSNTFSSPVFGTAVNPTDAEAFFDDIETAVSDSAIKTPQYVTLAADGALPNERVLTAGTNISLTDAGAGSTLTIAISDAELNALAGLTSAADKVPYFTGSGTASLGDFTSYGRSLVAAASEAAFKALVNLEIGTDVQAYDAELAAIAGLTSAADKAPYFTGSGTAALADFTSYGRSIVAVANEAAFKALVNLEAGTDVQAYNARLADIAGASWAQGDITYFNGTNLVRLPAGTNGQLLKTQGTGANPTWVTASGTGDMLSANNLSDVTNAATALSNLNGVPKNATATITAGYTLTPNNLGTMSSFTLDPALGNYQYGTNNGALTITAPASDCAVDIIITNGASAGAITFSGFTVPATPGGPFTTTNGHRHLVSIRRVNGVSTYSNYPLQ